MAYDPNDPADKKIMDAAIKKAREDALAEANEEHEALMASLKAKNKDLLNKIAKNEGGQDTAEVARLEGEVRELTKQLKVSTKNVETLTAERDEAKTSLEKDSGFSRNLLIENGLTAELSANKVATQFLPAARALLSPKVAIKVEGENRTVVGDGKPLAEFVKAWAASDDGKHYVAAPSNGGGGSHGSGGNQAPNAELSKLSPTARMTAAREAQAGAAK